MPTEAPGITSITSMSMLRTLAETDPDVARAIDNPRAVRAVGSANGRNRLPIVIPCHRVVNTGGKLGGYGGGLWRKVRLLEIEGVKV